MSQLMIVSSLDGYIPFTLQLKQNKTRIVPIIKTPDENNNIDYTFSYGENFPTRTFKLLK